MKAYFMNSYTPGYGPRIFVPNAHVPKARPVLDSLCRWGGADKDTGRAEGWEFGKEEYFKAIEALKVIGFSVDGVGDHNHAEIWP